MATQIIETVVDKRNITIIRFSRGSNQGFGFQVSWGLDKWVQFNTENEAREFAKLIENSIDFA